MDETTDEQDGLPSKLTVETHISLFRNSLILKQLALVLLIPLLFLAVLMTVLVWPPDGDDLRMIATAVGVSGGIVFILMMFSMAVVLRGRYDYVYRFTQKGVSAAVGGTTAKTTSIVNTLLLFTGNPTAMGAGLIARSRSREYVSWDDVESVKGDESSGLVELIGPKGRLMSLLCSVEDFEVVLRFSEDAVRRTSSDGA